MAKILQKLKYYLGIITLLIKILISYFFALKILSILIQKAWVSLSRKLSALFS